MANTPYVKFLRGTATQYAALSVKDSDTLYFINEPGDEEKVGKLYLGDVLIAGNTTTDSDGNPVSNIDTLAELKDIDLAGLANGSILKYDSATQKWIAAEIEIPEVTPAQVFADIIPTEGQSHNDAIAAATASKILVAGDIAIVKELIAGSKYQYTAYVYNGTAWAAMDGNYNAENVYFDEDLTYTSAIGVLSAPAGGNGTIAATGKNIKDVLAAILAKEDLSLTIDTPSVSFSVSADATGEVGTTFSYPTITLKVTDIGSYEYGSKDENGTTYTKTDTNALFNTLTIKKEDTVKKTETGSFTTGKTISYTVTSDDTVITTEFGDTVKEMDFNYVASYNTSDRKPVTNLGNFINSAGAATSVFDEGTKAIAANTLQGSKTWKATGYRKMFWGYKSADDALADPTAITSAQVRALQNSGTSAPTTYTVTAGTKQVYFVLPTGKKSSLTIANKSALSAPVACEKVASGVNVEGANGYTAAAYDLWYVNLDASFSGDAELALTWK